MHTDWHDDESPSLLLVVAFHLLLDCIGIVIPAIFAKGHGRVFSPHPTIKLMKTRFLSRGFRSFRSDTWTDDEQSRHSETPPAVHVVDGKEHRDKDNSLFNNEAKGYIKG
ncbi:hypothetical protein LA080_011490 [Diaporthe eres]|nr:hypothetical protein LA080_011490 [Diaporthe eres]